MRSLLQETADRAATYLENLSDPVGGGASSQEAVDQLALWLFCCPFR